MINNTVLTEVVNSLKLQNNAENPSFDLDKSFNFLSNSLEVEYLNEDDYKSAKNIMKQFKSINYSDCTILRTMQNNNINKIVSFDSDFDKISGLTRICL